MIVVQSPYTLLIDGKKIPLRAGEEYFIPRGGPHGGEVLARDQNHPRLRRAPGGAGSGALGRVFGRSRLSSIQGSSTTAS